MSSGFNWLILVLVIILFIFSLALIFSLAPADLAFHALSVLIGLIGFGVASRIDYRLLDRFSGWLFFLTSSFLLITLFLGSRTRQTLRWIKLGSLTFQPSEIVKPFLILIFASLAARSNWSFKDFLISLAALILPAFLIFRQPDLSSALMIALVWLVIFVFRLNKKQLILLGFISLVGILGGKFILKDYQADRIFGFLNPQEDPLGINYHLIQSRIAAGSGKFFGRGLFRGTQSHLRFLPERQSDFIFASLAEELGFVGSISLLTIYFFLLAQILKTARRASDEFGFFICLGVFGLFFGQIFINVGMNLGLLPVTGITLPLISSGGSSILGLMMGLGLVESVAGRVKPERWIEIK
ncbi:MAG: rod shape-determining protein RodA [Candidatus Pacebacteria bacterium]|nr:rod shape-determining protein RodA [Candidatus Paceibacterota bacterium]